MTPPRHLVLVGPMGAGKTTIGTLLSAATGLPLVDNDRVLATTPRGTTLPTSHGSAESTRSTTASAGSS